VSSYICWSPPGDSARPSTPSEGLRLRRGGPDPWEQFADPTRLTLAEVVHHERMIAAYYALRAGGARAAGLGGISCRDLGPREVASCMRELSEIVLAGGYVPARRKKVLIPKSDGRRKRPIEIGTLADRVLSKALYLALERAIDPTFLAGSQGFRSGRSHYTLLAALEVAIRDTGCYVLATDDVADAFPSLPIAPILDGFREHVRDEPLLRLIERVLRGADRPDRARGIAQGDPLSPLALNLLLHTVHDVPLGGDVTEPPWFRYADDLAYLSRDVTGGRHALDSARILLAAADLVPKGADGEPADLRTGTKKLLGFRISWGDHRLRLDLDDGAYTALAGKLAEAHQDANPPDAARKAAEGWVASHGPASAGSRGDMVLDRVVGIAGAAGFREMSRERLRAAMVSSVSRWMASRRDARDGRGRRRRGSDHGVSAAYAEPGR
jgi:RNA-directed DNA polymerase